LGSTRIESKSELKPTSVKGESIVYGPYPDVKPFSFSAQRIHYENNSPFLTVRKLIKTIEVSHWGNVAVEEDYVIEHTGAKLKGQFSRYDFQRNPYGAATVIPIMRQHLPLYASDPYYRDESGNITTSFFSERSDGPLLELLPRFPLFGGWKFGYYIGYNLPTYHYLFTSYDDSSLHILNVTFGSAFDFAAIDEIVVKIILPEGAKSPEAHTPFSIDNRSTEKHYTYLDTAGRPVLVLEKKNVVSDHNRFFQVTYRFSSMALLHEPLLLITGFFLVFLGIILWVRLEFHIGPVRQSTPQTEKVDDLLIRFRDVLDQRAEVHSSLDSAANTAVRNKSVSTFENERRSSENSLASLKRLASAIIGEIEALDNDAARKLRELEKKEEARVVLVSRLRELEVEQITKKTGKKYEDEKASLERQISVADDEVDAVVTEVFDQ
jgi:oligosaccharyltransferase complex subunit alpha (ribophorin I)